MRFDRGDFILKLLFTLNHFRLNRNPLLPRLTGIRHLLSSNPISTPPPPEHQGGLGIPAHPTKLFFCSCEAVLSICQRKYFTEKTVTNLAGFRLPVPVGRYCWSEFDPDLYLAFRFHKHFQQPASSLDLLPEIAVNVFALLPLEIFHPPSRSFRHIARMG